MADTASADAAADTTSNGEAVSAADQFAADRAAFLSMAGGDEVAPKGDEDKSDDAEADDDADLEDDQDDDAVAEVDADADEDEDVEEDPDADLDDEDEEQPAAKDPKVAKGLEQLRKTDKRLREQRDKLFADRERELVAREESLKPRLEKLDRFEKLQARMRYEPEAVLLELGADEDVIDLAAKRLYAISKSGKGDPKWKAAADQLAKERERDDKLKAMEKQIAEREEAEKKAKAEAEERKEIDRHVDRFAAAASEKFPLAKHYLAKNPQSARLELEVVAGRIIRETGQMPSPKAVMKQFEIEQRNAIRARGLDPKAVVAQRAAAATTATSATTTKPTPKTGDKKTADKSKTKVDDAQPPTKEAAKAAFIRGELS